MIYNVFTADVLRCAILWPLTLWP